MSGAACAPAKPAGAYTRREQVPQVSASARQVRARARRCFPPRSRAHLQGRAELPSSGTRRARSIGRDCRLRPAASNSFQQPARASRLACSARGARSGGKCTWPGEAEQTWRRARASSAAARAPTRRRSPVCSTRRARQHPARPRRCCCLLHRRAFSYPRQRRPFSYPRPRAPRRSLQRAAAPPLPSRRHLAPRAAHPAARLRREEGPAQVNPLRW